MDFILGTGWQVEIRFLYFEHFSSSENYFQGGVGEGEREGAGDGIMVIFRYLFPL